MKKATFYHAGCPVCVSAEQDILDTIDQNKYALEIIHLGTAPDQIPTAEAAGVQSVPALVLENSNVLHINFGASMEDVKAA
ncbi:MAG: thioredoxin family protein [Bacteroidota bacterium]